jgi:hypothetical protein
MSIDHDFVLVRLAVPSEEWGPQLRGKTKGGLSIVDTTEGAITHHNLEAELFVFILLVVWVFEIKIMKKVFDGFFDIVDSSFEMNAREFEFHYGATIALEIQNEGNSWRVASTAWCLFYINVNATALRDD